MFEYTEGYFKPFSWAKKVYDYTLGLSLDTKTELSLASLTPPTFSQYNPGLINIETAGDWNRASKNHISLTGALFKTVDQGDSYFQALYSQVEGRLSESEKRVQELESSLRVLLNSFKETASTAIHVKGGDYTYLEQDDKFYRDYQLLGANLEEGVFRLRDTGFFSSIRSVGGFAGNVEVEESLGQITTNGTLSSITDGSRSTFWMGTVYAPAPMRADSINVPWLPSTYKHGFATKLTYYLDRSTLATEVFVDPVSTEPFTLVSVSWTPTYVSPTVSSFGTGWATVSGTVYTSSAYGSQGASGLAVPGSAGIQSYTFNIPTSQAGSGGTTYIQRGNRAQLHYLMKGIGDTIGGARLIWYNASGQVLDYKLAEHFPAGFYTPYRLVSSIPEGTVSGSIEFGIFSTASSVATTYFSNPTLYLGEEEYQVDTVIDKPTTINLPKTVQSARFSFVIAQTNPRREILTKIGSTELIPGLPATEFIDPSLRSSVDTLDSKYRSRGPESHVFAYKLGIKELDLRYRQYVPRGGFITLPLQSKKEIRQIWITSELGRDYQDSLTFNLYPFADDLKQKIEGVTPYIIGDTLYSSNITSVDGKIIKIFTDEEYKAGWVDFNDSNVFLVSPRKVVDRFDGTDREGKLKLSKAPHIRKPKVSNLLNWVQGYSAWGTFYDPNLETVYGINDPVLKEQLKSNTQTISLSNSGLVSYPGYLPIKVTVVTDKWTAVPDTFGRPDISKVKTVVGEILHKSNTIVNQVTNEYLANTISFDAWLNTTTPSSLIGAVGGISRLSLENTFIKYIYSANNADITLSQLLESFSSQSMSINNLTTQLKTIYDRLKAEGKVALDTSYSSSVTSTVAIPDCYSTRFKPIITGPNGTFLKLYWYNSVSVQYIPISRSAYTVLDPNMGLIQILSASPSGFTDIVAEYQYISYNATEDFFSSVINFVTTGVTATTDLSVEAQLQSRSLPITRNMTDYIDGRIPNMKAPNFQRLAKDYYPVIEYYVNSNGEIIFARDFFRYGDNPAKIMVEYESLNISPRLEAIVNRYGGHSQTPTIYNVSMRVREGSASPTRETVL